jgi:hypothetical protein
MHLIELHAALSGAGVPIPDGLTYAAQVHAEADRYAMSSTDDMVTSLRDAIERRALPPAKVSKALRDLAVEQATAAKRFTVAEHARKAARVAGRDAVADEAEELMAVMRPRFVEAAAVLAASLEPRPPAKDKPHASPYLSRVTSDRDDALAELNRLRGARLALGDVGYGSAEESAAWYTRPRNREQLLDGNSCFLRGVANSFVAMAELGLPLYLNTAAEADDVLQLLAKRPPVDWFAVDPAPIANTA